MLGAVVFAPFPILDDGPVSPLCVCNNLNFSKGFLGDLHVLFSNTDLAKTSVLTSKL